MSDPKRYYLYAGLECHAFSKVEAVLKFREEDDGMWVKYEDYSRLKAEVEVLDKIISRNTEYIQDQSLEIIALKAEVERLRNLLSISEQSVQNLLKTPEWTQITKLTADYRKLESENSRLRSLDSLKTVALADSIHTCSRGCKKSGCNRGLRDTIDELKAENERLRRAGDELDYLLTTKIMSYEVGHASWQWKNAKNAAKDGKPSE